MLANERAVIPAPVPVTVPVQVLQIPHQQQQQQQQQQQFGQVYSYEPIQHESGQVSVTGVVYALPVYYPQQLQQQPLQVIEG